MSPAGTLIIIYARVSTAGQDTRPQVEAAEAAARSRGWIVVEVCTDVAGGSSRKNRPGLARAIALVAAGQADALVVAKLDRLARSVVDFGQIIEAVPVVVLDMDLDMTTPVGEMVANILASFAQFERRLISERTVAALASKRAAGVQLGRPRTLPAEVEERIRAERAAGASHRAIAERLNDDGIPGAQGGRWHATSVARVLAHPGT
ncbi:MAG TPA: recombinase family protein [Acidimicrobiales bacterium]|nr:recombinase family protein [Acidimicrobiales bacterium]